MQGKKHHCLLIGGGGFIGSWLANNLTSKGYKVTILDPQFNYFPVEDKKFNNVIDFRTKHLLKNVTLIPKTFQETGEELLHKNNFAFIANLAAHAIEKPFDSSISTNQITNDINTNYTIISAIRNTKKNIKFVYMSSSAVYGEYDFAATENTIVDPKSIYGVSKATNEHLIKINLTNWNIVRSNAAFGYGDLGERATFILVDRAFNKQKAWVNDSVWCDFIYVKDLVEGIAQVMLHAPAGEIFNISGGIPHKLTTYVEEINQYLPFDYELRTVHDRPNRGVLVNAKAKMLLNWFPQFDLKSGIKDYMRYVKKYKSA